MARSITTRRPLWVQEVDFEDGTVGYATDGTPVDCVRLARLGLVEGFEAELVVAGDQPRLEPRRRHHVLGDRRGGARGDRARAPGDRRLTAVARARARLPARAARSSSRSRRASPRGSSPSSRACRCRMGRCSTSTCPAPIPPASRSRGSASGSTATSWRSSSRTEGRKQYRIYGDASYERDETGTDLAAVARGTDRGHADPLRPDRPRRDRGAPAVRPGDSCSRPAGRKSVAERRGSTRRESAPRSCASSCDTTPPLLRAQDDPEIGDDEYDALLDELRAIEADASRARHAGLADAADRRRAGLRPRQGAAPAADAVACERALGG